MSHAGQARNFESTLRGLADRGHEVHMAFDRLEKKNLLGLSELANSIVEEYPGVTSDAHPSVARETSSLTASRLRAGLDYMRYLQPEFTEAPKLRARAKRFAPPRLERMVSQASGVKRRLVRQGLLAAERSTPVSPIALEYVKTSDPDVVLVTPLLEPGNHQVEFLRAANRLGIPSCLCVASWDNLTNKGLIHEMPDMVAVWNESQKREAVDLHAVAPERVTVTGAVAYDHWFDWEPSRSRAAFAAAAGLDADRPFVLYVGSSGFIAPDEASYVVEWVRELEAHGCSDIQILARPHPSNPLVGSSEAQTELATLHNVRLYPAQGANPTNAEARKDYFDSLYYASAVAGVNTSAFLEAAIVGRPVFTVTTDRNRDTQEGVLHFHHLLEAGGGLLHLSESYADHAALLRNALEASHPDEATSDRSVRFTEVFIRPYGLDEPATPRMLDAIEAVATDARAQAPTSRRRTLTGRLVGRAAARAIIKEQRRRDEAKKRTRAKKPQAARAPREEKAARAAQKARKQAERDAKAATRAN
jgi:hypothetical protein